MLPQTARLEHRKGQLPMPVPLVCLRCGKPFTLPPSRAARGEKYCSHACAFPQVLWTCPVCGRCFRTPPSIAKAKKYCSRSCFYETVPAGMSSALRTRRYQRRHKEQLMLKRRTPAARAKAAAAMRKWRAEHTEKARARDRAHNVKAKALMLAAYSGACACCGETEPAFLCIDHINGGGNRHLREIKKRGTRFWDWVRQQNYPPQFRLLCFNCNNATRWGRLCPHQAKATANSSRSAL